MKAGVRVLAWCVVAALAFRLGFEAGDRRDAIVQDPVPVAPVEVPRPRAIEPAPVPVALPDKLHTLGGREFLAAMPTLERLARGGRADALRVLFQHLDACVNFKPPPGDAVPEWIDVQYANELAIEKLDAATCERRRSEGQSCEAGELREQRVLAANQRREECTALSAAQIGSRIAWARLAVDRGDRDMVVLLRGPNTMRDMPRTERVRELDALVALGQRSREEMDRLVDAGDLDALWWSMLGFRSGGNLVDQDFVAAHAAYLVLARAAPERVAGFGDAAGRLTPAQLAEAQARADAMYARCCAR